MKTRIFLLTAFLCAALASLQGVHADTNAASASSPKFSATPAPGKPYGDHNLVWVNTETHVYVKFGSRFYGTSKKGKYVSEADAIKEGDKPAQTGSHYANPAVGPHQ